MASQKTVQFGTMGFGSALGASAEELSPIKNWLVSLEDAGFDLISCGDSQSLWMEPTTMMAYASTVTKKANLGIVMSNPITRHPALAASSAATVSQISGGRLRYGIARGDSALRTIGLPTPTLSEFEEYVSTVKALTRGESATWQGSELKLHWLKESARVPIWMAAEGPRTLRIAGRFADGVVLSHCFTAERLRGALEHLQRGADDAGRSLDEIEVWCQGLLVFAPSESEGIDTVRSLVAGSARHVYSSSFDGKQVPAELQGSLTSMMAEYQSTHHGLVFASNPNNELMDKYGLRSFLAPQATITGPPERCVERINEILAGVDSHINLILLQNGADPKSWLETFAADVRPAFG